DTVVGETGDIPPVLRSLPQPLRHRVGAVGIAVTEHFEALAVVKSQDVLKEEGDGMVAKVRGNVPDAQSLARRAADQELPTLVERGGMPPRPFRVLMQQPPVTPREVVQRQ